MWLYWVLFLWPAIAALGLVESRTTTVSTAVGREWGMAVFAIALTLVIGLRFEVGVDWAAYIEHLLDAQDLTWLEVVQEGDPAYQLLNWIGANTGSGVWLVNLVCATAFVSGFVVFSRTLPNPWLAIAVGMPYMAIVMTMNYSRQGAAMGFVLWALAALKNGNIRRYVLLIAVAALFHKTAAILVCLGVLGSTRNRVWTLIWVAIASAVAFGVFLSEHQEALAANYIQQEQTSDGAGPRVAMNAVAAIVFLSILKYSNLQSSERQLWTLLSCLVLLFVPALMLSPSSTAVDRVALYFMPIQLAAYSYLPVAAGAAWGRRAIIFSIVAAYATVLYVWFTYANFSFAWLPYKFYPLEFQ